MNHEDAEGLDILRKAYPDLNDEQSKEAYEALDQYFKVVSGFMRGFVRIRSCMRSLRGW